MIRIEHVAGEANHFRITRSNDDTGAATPEPTAVQLVHRYNVAVARAAALGFGFRPVRCFHDKPTALERIAHVELVVARGVRADEPQPSSEDLQDAAARGKTEDITDAGEENEVKTKSKKAARAKTPKAAKAKKAPKMAAARAGTNGHVVRAGSKTEVVRDLLTRKSGCTSREVLDATGWPAVSMPAMAKACGLELRKEKEKGSRTQYYGS